MSKNFCTQRTDPSLWVYMVATNLPCEFEILNVQYQKISILPSQKGLEFPGGWGDSLRPKKLTKCIKFNWNFQRGGWEGGGSWKNPFHGEVWIFSGTTQSLETE